MGQEFLIDTNVVIEVLGGNTLPTRIKKELLCMPPVISAVTYMETLGWYRATPFQIQIIQMFMSSAIILPINQPIIEKTVFIRQQKKIGLGDAIIAATAMVYNMTVVTRNISDFKSINDLKVLNPWEI
jgi:predicted nucleic acid-binding protein